MPFSKQSKTIAVFSVVAIILIALVIFVVATTNTSYDCEESIIENGFIQAYVAGSSMPTQPTVARQVAQSEESAPVEHTPMIENKTDSTVLSQLQTDVDRYRLSLTEAEKDKIRLQEESGDCKRSLITLTTKQNQLQTDVDRYRLSLTEAEQEKIRLREESNNCKASLITLQASQAAAQVAAQIATREAQAAANKAILAAKEAAYIADQTAMQSETQAKQIASVKAAQMEADNAALKVAEANMRATQATAINAEQVARLAMDIASKDANDKAARAAADKAAQEAIQASIIAAQAARNKSVQEAAIISARIAKAAEDAALQAAADKAAQEAAIAADKAAKEAADKAAEAAVQKAAQEAADKAAKEAAEAAVQKAAADKAAQEAADKAAKEAADKAAQAAKEAADKAAQAAKEAADKAAQAAKEAAKNSIIQSGLTAIYSKVFANALARVSFQYKKTEMKIASNVLSKMGVDVNRNILFRLGVKAGYRATLSSKNILPFSESYILIRDLIIDDLVKGPIRLNAFFSKLKAKIDQELEKEIKRYGGASPLIAGPFDQFTYDQLIAKMTEQVKQITSSSSHPLMKAMVDKFSADVAADKFGQSDLSNDAKLAEYFSMIDNDKVCEQAQSQVCASEKGKVITMSDGSQACSYPDEASCHSSYTTPLGPTDRYAEFKSNVNGGACVVSSRAIRNLCESANLTYDTKTGQCGITESDCKSQNGNWIYNSESKSYDCEAHVRFAVLRESIKSLEGADLYEKCNPDEVDKDGMCFKCSNSSHSIFDLNVCRIANPSPIVNDIKWTLNTTKTETNSYWQSVCWSPELSLFVAVGSDTSPIGIGVSKDGIDWIFHQTLSNGQKLSHLFRSVCWSPTLSMFLAVGYGDVVASKNGYDWQVVSKMPLLSVCWSPKFSSFVGIGTNNGTSLAATSSDGINWKSEKILGIAKLWKMVCWSPELSLFVAIAGGDNNTQNIATSKDMLTWEIRSVDAINLSSICWSSKLSLFVVVSNSNSENCVFTSPNGIDWTGRATGAANSLSSVCWAPELSLFVAGGRRTSYAISSDGINWTIKQVSGKATNAHWVSICWSSKLSKFVVVSMSNNNIISGDPISSCPSPFKLENNECVPEGQIIRSGFPMMKNKYLRLSSGDLINSPESLWLFNSDGTIGWGSNFAKVVRILPSTPGKIQEGDLIKDVVDITRDMYQTFIYDPLYQTISPSSDKSLCFDIGDGILKLKKRNYSENQVIEWEVCNDANNNCSISLVSNSKPICLTNHAAVGADCYIPKNLRNADCPSGYINNGASCVMTDVVTGDCPSNGFLNPNTKRCMIRAENITCGADELKTRAQCFKKEGSVLTMERQCPSVGTTLSGSDCLITNLPTGFIKKDSTAFKPNTLSNTIIRVKRRMVDL